MPRTRLSAAEARRIALAAQGLAEPRRAGGRAVRRLFDRVALIQIDSVNVLSRAHYLPGFARLGAYDRDALDRAAYYAPRRLFEYWGHEASLMPVELHPLMRWRMERAHDEAWGGMRRVAQERPELLRDGLEQVRGRGRSAPAPPASRCPSAGRSPPATSPSSARAPAARGGTGPNPRRRSSC